MMLHKHHFFALGTRIRVAVEANQPLDLCLLAEDWLRQEEEIFSLHSKNSILSRINASAGKTPVTCPPQLYKLIEIGKSASLETYSQLNIAIAPLVKLWQIGFADARVPRADDISKHLPLCQPQDIILNSDKQSIYLTKPGMGLDLGALAKGYLADRLWQQLAQAGARSGLLDFGGNVLVRGQTKSVGLQIPFEKRGTSLGQVKVSNKAVTTSGIYERFFEKNGQSFHHILDRKTGYPTESDLTSLTIISPTALEGEILTSQLFGQDKQTILNKVEDLPEIDAILLTKNRQILMTSGARECFTPHFIP